jgi:hypothetical protein
MTTTDKQAGAAVRRRMAAKSLWAGTVGVYLLTIVFVRMAIRYWAYPSVAVMPLFGSACMFCAGMMVAGLLILFWPTRVGQLILAFLASALVFSSSLFIFVFGTYLIPRTTGPIDGTFNHLVMASLSVIGGSLLYVALKHARSVFGKTSAVVH